MKGDEQMKIKRMAAAFAVLLLLVSGACAAEDYKVPRTSLYLDLPAMAPVPAMYTEYSDIMRVTAVWLSMPVDQVMVNGVNLTMQEDNTAWFAYGDIHGPMYCVTVGKQTSWHYSTGEPYCVLTETSTDVFNTGKECNGSLVIWKQSAYDEWYPYCVAADYKEANGERTLIAYYMADKGRTLESYTTAYDIDISFVRTHYLTDGAFVNEADPLGPLNDRHAEKLRREWVTGEPWRSRFYGF